MRRIWILALAILWLQSCGKKRSGNDEVLYNVQNHTLVEMHKELVDKEQGVIDRYIDKSNLDFERTGTGLAYAIVGKPGEMKIERDARVTLRYNIENTEKVVLYSSSADGLKHLVVGRREYEAGLDELLLKLHWGDSAVALLPSHLAYGLYGDNHKIEPGQVIVYKVKVVQVLN